MPDDSASDIFEPMKCHYCKREMHTRQLSFDGLRKTRDHHVPVSRGGSNAKENIRMACIRCNGLKGNMMPAEWEQYMRDNPLWWAPQVNIKCQVNVPVAKLATTAALKAMTAQENEWRLRIYLERETPEHLSEADSKYLRTYGKKRFKEWAARGRPTPPYDLRPLRADEPLPIEYPDDPMKQAAFEAAYKDRRWLLRVPIWVPKENAIG